MKHPPTFNITGCDVQRYAEIDRNVRMDLECAGGCGKTIEVEASRLPQCRKLFEDEAKRHGWITAYDPKVNDGTEPYCRECADELWPDLFRQGGAK